MPSTPPRRLPLTDNQKLAQALLGRACQLDSDTSGLCPVLAVFQVLWGMDIHTRPLKRGLSTEKQNMGIICLKVDGQVFDGEGSVGWSEVGATAMRRLGRMEPWRFRTSIAPLPVDLKAGTVTLTEPEDIARVRRLQAELEEWILSQNTAHVCTGVRKQVPRL